MKGSRSTSKDIARIAQGDETGRVLGAGSGGPCNHVGAAVGRQKLIRAVSECVAKACEGAGLDPATVGFEAACFGMSGGPEDKQAILAEILRADTLIATNDAVIALAGATAGRPGIITIAGTGSIAFGRNAEFWCAFGETPGSRRGNRLGRYQPSLAGAMSIWRPRRKSTMS